MMSTFSMIRVSLVGLAVLLTAVQVKGDCPNIQGCNFDSDDCTSLKCSTSFMGKDISLGIKLNICEKDITTTIKVDVFGSTFSHTFSSEENVPIPSLDFGRLGKVYLKFKMSRNDNKEVHLKVALAVKIVSFGKSVTIVDENLGEIRKSMDCGILIWLDDQPVGVSVGVYGGMCVVLIIIISIICCCCKKRSPGIVLQPFQMQVAAPGTIIVDGPVNQDREYVKF